MRLLALLLCVLSWRASALFLSCEEFVSKGQGASGIAEVHVFLEELVNKTLHPSLKNPDSLKIANHLTEKGFCGLEQLSLNAEAQTLRDVFLRFAQFPQNKEIEKYLRESIAKHLDQQRILDSQKKQILIQCEKMDNVIFVLGVPRALILKGPDGEVYFEDISSQVVWGPESAHPMNYWEASDYCEKIDDLGLTWSLPSSMDFIKAFDAENMGVGQNKIAAQSVFKSTSESFLWASLPYLDEEGLLNPWCFKPDGHLDNFPDKRDRLLFRCVGKKPYRQISRVPLLKLPSRS